MRFPLHRRSRYGLTVRPSALPVRREVIRPPITEQSCRGVDCMRMTFGRPPIYRPEAGAAPPGRAFSCLFVRRLMLRKQVFLSRSLPAFGYIFAFCGKFIHCLFKKTSRQFQYINPHIVLRQVVAASMTQPMCQHAQKVIKNKCNITKEKMT